MNEPLSSIDTDFSAAFAAPREIVDGPLTIKVRPKRLEELEVADAVWIGDANLSESRLALTGTMAPGRHRVWIAEATFSLEGGEPGSRVACALLGEPTEVSTWERSGSVEVGGTAAFVGADGIDVTFSSGWGPGVYDVWVGNGSAGAPVALALDFRVLLKPVFSEIALGDTSPKPLGPVQSLELETFGLDLSVVAASRVPSYLRDSPGHEPEYWLRLDCRAADADRFADASIIGYDRAGNERFVPVGNADGISYTPLDGEPYDLKLRYVSGLRVL